MTEPAGRPEVPDNQESLALQRALRDDFGRLELLRPFRQGCYHPGDILTYHATGVFPANTARITLEVVRFIGGGFAGQVYKVQLRDVEPMTGPIDGLEVGRHYAIKILKPPSTFANWFRNVLYFVGYQTSFSPQVLPAAVRAGVLWQKMIRRAALVELGDEHAVCDTYATFYDEDQQSFGEINEWIDGRIWKFEVDDRLFSRWRFTDMPRADHKSPEYVYKKLFMQRLVSLLHEMGLAEFARQYEWWTCKSQPNVLKRLTSGDDPSTGLVAIDFRAGLTLLPFLPMSPADIWLILKGLTKGSLVQFDRSEPKRFHRFVRHRQDAYRDLEPAIRELIDAEKRYRRSQPDITHHHIRLLTDSSLRHAVREGRIASWHYEGTVDAVYAEKLTQRHGLFCMLYLVSWIPLLGRRLISLIGHAPTRLHVKQCLTDSHYLLRAFRGSRIEVVIRWLESKAVDRQRARLLVENPGLFWIERLSVGWLPAKWHRAMAEPRWAWSRLRNALRRGIRFLRDPEYREERLLEQVELGRDEGSLTDSEADRIVHEIKDPYIQKYLKCLAVHLCTVPITQIVMLLAGATVTAYCLAYRHLSWAESVAYGTAAAATIQLLPISPGSITRGVFVLFLMIKERDIKNYYVAAPISFIHVIGYLAFPFQMVTHNAALARFLAGRWSRSTVHLVPVFGEKGALLEHAVFDFFFNVPLSMRRGFRERPLVWWTGSVVTIGVLVVVILALLGRL